MYCIVGHSFCFDCYVGRRGCKPWFIKQLPHKMETLMGKDVEMRCTVGNPTDEHAGPELDKHLGKLRLSKKKREGG